MRTSPLAGIILLLVIIIGVLLWFFVGEPLIGSTGTATTTTQVGNNTNTENDGQTGVRTPSQLEARVVVDAPKANANVPKTFTVTGKAPGPWYFEASFPIEVRSATGTLLTTGIATALTDWMTTDDVAFKADITVSGYTGPATLVLMRDNASGLPENDASISVPITIQ